MMGKVSRHDSWNAGNSYDRYMGRWSRQIAPMFLDWLDVEDGLEWLEVGCGTGALSAAILSRCNPKSITAIDPSEGLLRQAQENVPDIRVEFQIGDAEELPLPGASRDVAVSGLVLNFVPDRHMALSEMKRVTRPGGRVAFYVWDYPGGGVEFMRAFWNAATALDPKAVDLTEDRRFPFCTSGGLVALATSAGLATVEHKAVEAATVFRDFDDFWEPFTLGAGPAPGYCVSLSPKAQQRLKDKLRDSLPIGENGAIALKARAWAIKATVP